MSASDLYKAGQLQAAIDAQVQEVKGHPADQARRLFLFELLVFAGDLDRARRQIEAIQYDEPELVEALQTYRKLLDAETARRKLFADGVPPLFLATPPEHVPLRLEALNRLREGKQAEAAELLARPAAASHEIKGTLNGKPFATFRDADDLFGSVLEVLSRGQYFWVPVESIDKLVKGAPRFPRDLIWAAAHLSLHDGPEGDVFLPLLYPGSEKHADDQIKLGRATDWKNEPGGPVLGQGAKTYLVDEDASSLLEWRELIIAH